MVLVATARRLRRMLAVTVMGVLVVPTSVRGVRVVSGGRAVHVLVLCRGHPEPAP
jgi:hypothetical protein